MAITFIAKGIKPKHQIYILAGLILILIILVWVFVFKKVQITPVEAPSTEPVQVFEKININFKILENPVFQGLKEIEQIPTLQGEVGRKNPFYPF